MVRAWTHSQRCTARKAAAARATSRQAGQALVLLVLRLGPLPRSTGYSTRSSSAKPASLTLLPGPKPRPLPPLASRPAIGTMQMRAAAVVQRHAAALPQPPRSRAARPARGRRLQCSAMAPPKQQMLVRRSGGAIVGGGWVAPLPPPAAAATTDACWATMHLRPPSPRRRSTCRRTRWSSTGWQCCVTRTRRRPSSAPQPQVRGRWDYRGRPPVLHSAPALLPGPCDLK